MHLPSVKSLSLITLTIITVTQLGTAGANPLPQWDKDKNDPYGISIGGTNTDQWGRKNPLGTSSNLDSWGKTSFGNTNDSNERFFGKSNEDTFGSDFETRSREFDKEFERNRKTAQSMFWVVASIIIVTFILLIVGIIACICIPTCYLARYRGRRSEGRIYHQPNPTPGAVPMTGYPTQPVTSGAPPAYPYPPQQHQAQYPYPPNSNLQQQQQMPMQMSMPSPGYPNQTTAPYPTATAVPGGNPPYNPNYGAGANQIKSPYPDLPYPTN